MGIPVTIITGALGAGKTTAIKSILATRPKEEHWAVLVNEFGAVGIDAALLSSDEDGNQDPKDKGFTVRQVAGGCMCCAAGTPLTMVLVQLIRQTKPQRLLIEPSGVGHPATMVDILRNEHLKNALDLRAVVCLVDPRTVASNAELRESEGFISQVSISDVIVANKMDVASPKDVAAFDDWSQQLFPPKVHVSKVSQGAFDPSLLDIPFALATLPPLALSAQKPGGQSFLVNRNESSEPHAPPPEEPPTSPPNKGQPVLGVMQNSEHASAGWVFSTDDQFQREHLQILLTRLMRQPGVVRCKGVFRISGGEWVKTSLLPSSPGENPDPAPLEAAAYRRESRVELITEVHRPDDGQNEVTKRLAWMSVTGDQNPNVSHEEVADAAAEAAQHHVWAVVEAALLRCLKK